MRRGLERVIEEGEYEGWVVRNVEIENCRLLFFLLMYIMLDHWYKRVKGDPLIFEMRHPIKCFYILTQNFNSKTMNQTQWFVNLQVDQLNKNEFSSCFCPNFAKTDFQGSKIAHYPSGPRPIQDRSFIHGPLENQQSNGPIRNHVKWAADSKTAQHYC